MPQHYKRSLKDKSRRSPGEGAQDFGEGYKPIDSSDATGFSSQNNPFIQTPVTPDLGLAVDKGWRPPSQSTDEYEYSELQQNLANMDLDDLNTMDLGGFLHWNDENLGQDSSTDDSEVLTPDLGVAKDKGWRPPSQSTTDWDPSVWDDLDTMNLGDFLEWNENNLWTPYQTQVEGNLDYTKVHPPVPNMDAIDHPVLTKAVLGSGGVGG